MGQKLNLDQTLNHCSRATKKAERRNLIFIAARSPHVRLRLSANKLCIAPTKVVFTIQVAMPSGASAL
jgi:hypothetical protein